MENTQLWLKTPNNVQRSEHTEISDSQLGVTIFSPMGHLVMSGDLFSCHKWEADANGI